MSGKKKLYILIWDSCMIITDKSAESHFPLCKLANTSPFKKKHDQKEQYSTIVAVVEVVALLKDCFEQTSKWSLDVCKWF